MPIKSLFIFSLIFILTGCVDSEVKEQEAESNHPIDISIHPRDIASQRMNAMPQYCHETNYDMKECSYELAEQIDKEILEMTEDLEGFSLEDFKEWADEAIDQEYPCQDFLTRMIYAEFRQRLPELLLMRVDKITMSTSVEARVPFLDHHLVEYSMNIPQASKIRGRNTKAILKLALKGIIPDEIINRPKMGFSAPVSDWLKGDLGFEVESSLLSSPLV